MFAVVLLGSGCQEKNPESPTPLVDGAPNLKVLDVRYVSSLGAAGGTAGGFAQNYGIVRVHFTNDLSDQLFPIISHFVYATIDGYRIPAADSGSSALVGISNDYSAMKRGDSRDFTLGFRLTNPQPGQIVYEY